MEAPFSIPIHEMSFLTDARTYITIKWMQVWIRRYFRSYKYFPKWLLAFWPFQWFLDFVFDPTILDFKFVCGDWRFFCDSVRMLIIKKDLPTFCGKPKSISENIISQSFLFVLNVSERFGVFCKGLTQRKKKKREEGRSFFLPSFPPLDTLYQRIL